MPPMFKLVRTCRGQPAPEAGSQIDVWSALVISIFRAPNQFTVTGQMKLDKMKFILE